MLVSGRVHPFLTTVLLALGLDETRFLEAKIIWLFANGVKPKFNQVIPVVVTSNLGDGFFGPQKRGLLNLRSACKPGGRSFTRSLF